MTTAAFQRVWKTMIQTFGPQWTERWGKENEAWVDALKDLTYSQVKFGLKAVINSRMKYFEVDLPAFIGLCRTVAPIQVRQAMTPRKLDWQNGMSQAEIEMNCFANKRMVTWMVRKEMVRKDAALTEEQQRAVWSSCRRICKDFWEMRQELGAEKVPDSDLVIALERQWERDLNLGVSA